MKWESIPEIKERTGKTHDQVVKMIREGMARKCCHCLPDISPYGSAPLFFFGPKSEAQPLLSGNTTNRKEETMELINQSEATRIMGMGKRANAKALEKVGLKPVYIDGKHGPTLYDKAAVMAAKAKMPKQELTLEERVARLEKAVFTA